MDGLAPRDGNGCKKEPAIIADSTNFVIPVFSKNISSNSVKTGAADQQATR
jgi:hypothetical protein